MSAVVEAKTLGISVIDGKTKAGDIPVGGSPVAIAVNLKTRLTYVANRDSNTVSVIDGKTNNLPQEWTKVFICPSR